MKLSDRLDLIAKSLSDLSLAHQMLAQTPDSQFLRRNYYHHVFACVETILWIHRQICCDRLISGSENKFWAGELALLRGESYEFDGINGAKIVSHHMSTIDNTRFTFCMIEKLVKKDLEPAFNLPEWISFRNATMVRNRLSHPRNCELLYVSEQEIEELDSGLKWFVGQVNSINQILKSPALRPNAVSKTAR